MGQRGEARLEFKVQSSKFKVQSNSRLGRRTWNLELGTWNLELGTLIPIFHSGPQIAVRRSQIWELKKNNVMALPFLNGTAKVRDQMLAIDLGGRTTKAVCLQRKAEGFVLSRYALLDAPIYERNPSPELLGEHFKSICQALDAKTRHVTLALGVNDALTRHADLPQMPVGEMRQILKNNTKNYLQQDLPGHIFDCFIIAPRSAPK